MKEICCNSLFYKQLLAHTLLMNYMYIYCNRFHMGVSHIRIYKIKATCLMQILGQSTGTSYAPTQALTSSALGKFLTHVVFVCLLCRVDLD